MIANDEMYRWIVEAVPEGIWIADPQGRTIFSNRRMAEILGADYESMSARTCFDCIYPDELADAQDRFQRCLEGDRSPFDFRLCRTDGSPVWVSISCMIVRDNGGAPVGLLGLFTDITARKRAEEALRESEGRFRTVADSAPVMLWMSGPDEQVTFFNRRGAEFTGRPAGQLLGSGWLEIIHPDDSEYAQSRYRAAASSKSTDEFEYRARRADGDYRHMLATTCARFVGDVYAGQIGTMIDITGVKRRQEADLAGQKLEIVGTLAAGIAHDFNNLLGGILAQVELASAEVADGQSPEEPLESIRVVATRGADIVRQLMLYAGQEDQDPELVDVSRLAAETVQLLRLIVAKQVVLAVDLGEDAGAVRANPAQLRQVLMNLVINAAEAIGDCNPVIRIGTARVAVCRDSEPGIAGSLPDGDYVRLEVSDQGCGMSPETQARVFDPFFTTKAAGRGLGLAVVQGILRGLGGTIDLTSALGRGTTFRILLPRVPCADLQLSAASDARTPPSVTPADRSR